MPGGNALCRSPNSLCVLCASAPLREYLGIKSLRLCMMYLGIKSPRLCVR